MIRVVTASLAILVALAAGSASAIDISGDYLESRTCDVYTGPCFANAQVGLAGQQAVMAWSIDKGQFQGVDLAGLNVVMAIRASDTLGFGGGMVVKPYPIRAVVLVDDRADAAQRDALVKFATEKAGPVSGDVVRVAAMPINMKINHIDMIGQLQAGKEVSILTRKLARGDCVCTNEEIYYPPLTAVDNSDPAYTVEGGFNGQGLGVRWSNPKTRSAFLATFAY